MSLSPEQQRKKAEARIEAENHMQHNVVGQKPLGSNMKPDLANNDSARGKETNSYDPDEIDNGGAVGGNGNYR